MRITTLVICTLVSVLTLTPNVYASVLCAGVFSSKLNEGSSSESAIPAVDLIARQLTEKERAKFRARFEKRDRVSAAREARRLIARILLKDSSSDLKLRPLFTADSREGTVKSLLNSRLDDISRSVRLENALIEIGFFEGSSRAKEWRDFRTRYATDLTIAKNLAINAASLYLTGLPLYLPSTRIADFAPTTAERTTWQQIEEGIRRRIDSGDPALTQQLEFEAALEIVRRIAAVAVLGLLADDFLNFLTPKWALIKKRAVESDASQSRESLETEALKNWKDITEAFTGQRPTDFEPKTVNFKEQLKANSYDDLWLHVHQNGPLKVLDSSSTSTISEPQMYQAPNLSP